MPTDKRRADARRRAWGRGPMILRFEPLEKRELLAATPSLPDLTGVSFQAPPSQSWGSTFQTQGVIVNQGNAAVSTPFLVDIYASPTPAVSQDSVVIGQVTVPAGLQPGAKSNFTQQVTLPVTPLNDLGSSGAFYVGMVIDPQNTVAESNEQNNSDTGAGVDYMLESPPVVQPASLVGTGLGLSSNQMNWGGNFQLTQQITNTGAGNAPATRALVVLTPAGDTPGTTADFSLGSISVPAIAAGQSTTISPTITLPSIPPSAFSGVTSYILSVSQDADYVTNQVYPHTATQGLGLDQAAMSITSLSVGAATATQSGLEVTGVATDSQAIDWGQSFQLGYTITNTSTNNAGSFRVRFLLAGTDGSIDNTLFLTDATLPGLAAGATQTFETTLTLPATLPAGETLNSALATIAVVVDPENTLDETRTATVGFSPAFQLQVAGTPLAQTPTATPTPTPTPSPTATATMTATATASPLPRPARRREPPRPRPPGPPPSPREQPSLQPSLQPLPRRRRRRPNTRWSITSSRSLGRLQTSTKKSSISTDFRAAPSGGRSDGARRDGIDKRESARIDIISKVGTRA